MKRSDARDIVTAGCIALYFFVVVLAALYGSEVMQIIAIAPLALALAVLMVHLVVKFLQACWVLAHRERPLSIEALDAMEMDPDPWPCIMTANHVPHAWFPVPGKIAECPGKPRSTR